MTVACYVILQPHRVVNKIESRTENSEKLKTLMCSNKTHNLLDCEAILDLFKF